MPIVTQFGAETSERIYVEILMAITKVAAHNGYLQSSGRSSADILNTNVSDEAWTIVNGGEA